MAKLTKITPPPVPPPTYTLELTQDEARFLRALMGSIGGAGEGRYHINSLYSALADGIRTDECNYNQLKGLILAP